MHLASRARGHLLACTASNHLQRKVSDLPCCAFDVSEHHNLNYQSQSANAIHGVVIFAVSNDRS